jgi:hypothetical protein
MGRAIRVASGDVLDVLDVQMVKLAPRRPTGPTPGMTGILLPGPCPNERAASAASPRRYFAGRNATWIWIATPGGGSKPNTSIAV